MEIKRISFAALTVLALSIASVNAFAANDNILSDLEKQLNSTNQDTASMKKDSSVDRSSAMAKIPSKGEDSLDDIESQLNNLKETIGNDGKKSNVVVSTVKDKKLDKSSPDTTNLNEQAAQDAIFMRNIPEGTRLTVTKDFTVLPLTKYIMFHDGKKVISFPKDSSNLTFCYIEFKPSGKARILKSDKVLTVTKNETTSDLVVNKNNENEKFKIFESKLSVDNDNIKWVSCYSSSKEDDKKQPLSIKDLRIQTGGSFKIEFPAYEEI